MTKEEFIEKTAEQDRIRRKASDKLVDIKNAYIDSNKRFDVGDKIEIKSPERKVGWGSSKVIPESTRIAFVVGHKVSWYDNSIEYLVKKAKKDGTVSSVNDYYQSSFDVLTLLS